MEPAIAVLAEREWIRGDRGDVITRLSEMDDRVNEDRVDVLVVGAGPAGLVAGITLARYGIDVLVVDKRETVSGLSRALVISTRGMELMRRFGLEAAVRAGRPTCCRWRG